MFGFVTFDGTKKAIRILGLQEIETSIFLVFSYFTDKKIQRQLLWLMGKKTVVFYLPVVTNTNTKKLECGWFTDSGFGMTILVVLAILKPRDAD